MLATHTPMLNSDSFLVLVGPLLQLPLLIILFRGGHYRRFPFFCLYTAYSMIMSGLHVWAMAHAALFFVLYWITEAILSLLELLALHEAFKPSLQAFYEVYRWIRLAPPAIVTLILGTALYRAAYHPVGRGPLVRLAAGAYAFEVGVRALEIAIFVLTLKLARKEHHPIGSPHPFGVVVGFGIAATGTLLADLIGFNLGFRFGHGFEIVFRYLPSAVYVGAVITWLIAFTSKEPPHVPLSREEVERRRREQERVIGSLRKESPRKRGFFRLSGI